MGHPSTDVWSFHCKYLMAAKQGGLRVPVSVKM
jgi:hypothetical protein